MSCDQGGRRDAQGRLDQAADAGPGTPAARLAGQPGRP